MGMIKDYMRDSNVKLLWNIVNMFMNFCFVYGVVIFCNVDVFVYVVV